MLPRVTADPDDETGATPTLAFGPRPPQSDAFAQQVRAAARARIFGRHRPEPHRWGRYVRLGRIGEGGMGVVYAVFDTTLKRRVALKVLRPELLGPSAAQARERLVREAQAMAQISHPNIAAVYEVIESDDDVMIAMELLEGTSVAHWERKPSRTWREVVELFVSAGRGLAAIHHGGLVHRDIKPANVVVTNEGRACIVDFGLARPSGEPVPSSDASDRSLSAEEVLTTITLDGVLVGTPRYMAPEQHLEGKVDARSDQYSFCVTLYEVLAGAAAFPQRSRDAILHAKESQEVDWSQLPALPRRLRHALERGLQADPERRFGAMDALLSELERSIRRAPVRTGLLAGAAVAIAVAAFFAGGLQQDEPSECPELDAEPWSDEARHGVRSAFLATEHPDAEKQWRIAAAALDRRAESLRTDRMAACTLQPSDPRREAELICLQMRARALAAGVATLRTMTRREIPRALEVVYGTGDTEACTPQTVRTPLPEGLDEGIAAARAELALGRRERSLELAVTTRDRAQRLGSLRAEVLARFAEAAAMGLTDPDARLDTLHRALGGALLLGDERLVASSLIRLVGVFGTSLRRPTEALRFATTAEGAISRIGEAPHLRARLHQQRGGAYLNSGDSQQAVEAFRAAFAALDEGGIDAPSLRMHVRYGLSGAHEAAGEHQLAREQLQLALAEGRETLGDLHPLISDMLNDLAVNSATSGRHEDARRELQATLDATAATWGTRSVEYAKTLGNLAFVGREIGRPPAEVMADFQQVHRLFEELLGPDHLVTATSLSNLCWYELHQDDATTAVGHCRDALEVLDRHLETGARPRVEALVRYGRALVSTGAIDEARRIVDRAGRETAQTEGRPRRDVQNLLAEVETAERARQ